MSPINATFGRVATTETHSGDKSILFSNHARHFSPRPSVARVSSCFVSSSILCGNPPVNLIAMGSTSAIARAKAYDRSTRGGDNGNWRNGLSTKRQEKTASTKLIAANVVRSHVGGVVGIMILT